MLGVTAKLVEEVIHIGIWLIIRTSKHIALEWLVKCVRRATAINGGKRVVVVQVQLLIEVVVEIHLVLEVAIVIVEIIFVLRRPSHYVGKWII